VDEYFLGDVYGVSRNIPFSYTPRTLDEQFLAALAEDKHIVLYGGNRQGKSTLARKHLDQDSCCVIRCAYGQRRYDVYRMLLRETGASVAVERKRRRARGIGAKVSIFSGDFKSDSETTERTIDIDIGNINDVLRVVADNGFEKTVIIDDFQYLGVGDQREIAEDLKVIYEKSSIKVIIMGTWEEEDRLVNLNGNLAGRVLSIYAGSWSADGLAEVVRAGEELLNVQFTDEIKGRLVAAAEGSVGLLQELCYRLCASAGITSNLDRRVRVDDVALVDDAVNKVLAVNSPRFRRFITSYSTYKKYRYGRPSLSRKWIMHYLLTVEPEVLLRAATMEEMFESIQRLYPNETANEEYTVEKLTKQARKIWRLQRAIGIQPTILAFNDTTETLTIVDRTFVLFLRHSDRARLVAYLPDGGRDAVDVDGDVSAGNQLVVPHRGQYVPR
jgi:hypothetical protein